MDSIEDDVLISTGKFIVCLIAGIITAIIFWPVYLYFIIGFGLTGLVLTLIDVKIIRK